MSDITEPPKNGCFDRKPFAPTQTIGRELVLYGETLVSHRVEIPNFTAADSSCQFTKSELGRVDLGCIGCRWRHAVSSHVDKESFHG